MRIKDFIHWLSHLFKMNEGRVATWIDGDSICVGFECDGCGKIDTKTIDRIPTNEVVPTDDKWLKMQIKEE